MGWLHRLNLKRKVIGALTDRPVNARTADEIANTTRADSDEVEALLIEMEEKGLVVSTARGSNVAYRLNEDQPTVAKVLDTLEARAGAADEGMILRPDEEGWTAELPDPAGLVVRGSTREEARERGLALMRRLRSDSTANR